MYERIASLLIGSPLQRPAEMLRWAMGVPKRLRNPELREIYLEGGRAKSVLKAAISDGMNCIDVGCHLGSVLQEIVRLSPSGRHLAIEPLSYKAAWLRRKFPAVEIREVALGDKEGTVEFFFNHRRSGYSGLRPHDPSGTIEILSVECKKLDDIVPADRRIGFMKVDVEGGEYPVFLGARRIIADSRPVILFECASSGLESFGYTGAQMYSLFTDDFKYDIFFIKDWLSGGLPLSFGDFESSMVYPFKAFNYVAAPKRPT